MNNDEKLASAIADSLGLLARAQQTLSDAYKFAQADIIADEETLQKIGREFYDTRRDLQRWQLLNGCAQNLSRARVGTLLAEYA